MKSFAIGIAFIAGATAAHAIVIDDFTSGAYSDSITSGSSAVLSQNGTMLGGIRDEIDTVLANPLGLHYSSTVTGGGFSAVSSDPLVQGETLLAYGFDSTGIGFDLNQDFSSQSAVTLSVLSNDLPATATLGIYTKTAGIYSYDAVTEAIPVSLSNPETVTFNFSDYTGLDFTNVTELELFVNPSASGDVVLTQISTSVPEPASMAALALGVGAFIARRKKKA